MRRLRIGAPAAAAGLMAALVLAGALIWFLPALTRKQQFTAGVPTPPALFALAELPVPAHGQACMQTVTITPDSDVAVFRLRPAKPGPAGGPPVELLLRGAGYAAVVHVPGGYPGGSVSLPFAPPRESLIGTACFVNRGRTAVLLDGTTEPRTVARSATTVDGRSVVGDVALTFLSSRPKTVLDRLGEVFQHASNLTEGLIPVWLVWLIAVTTAIAIPLAAIAALWQALLADELAQAAGGARRPRGDGARP